MTSDFEKRIRKQLRKLSPSENLEALENDIATVKSSKTSQDEEDSKKLKIITVEKKKYFGPTFEQRERAEEARKLFSSVPNPEKRQSRLEALPRLHDDIVTSSVGRKAAEQLAGLDVLDVQPAITSKTSASKKSQHAFELIARDLKKLGPVAKKAGKATVGFGKASGRFTVATGKSVGRGYSKLESSKVAKLTRDFGTRFEQRFLVPEEQQLGFFDNSQLRTSSDKTRNRIAAIASGIPTPEMIADRQREINSVLKRIVEVERSHRALDPTDPRQSALALESDYLEKQKLPQLYAAPVVSNDVRKIAIKQLEALNKLERAKEERKEKAKDVLHLKRKVVITGAGRLAALPFDTFTNPRVIGENVARATSRRRGSELTSQPTIDLSSIGSRQVRRGKRAGWYKIT